MCRTGRGKTLQVCKNSFLRHLLSCQPQWIAVLSKRGSGGESENGGRNRHLAERICYLLWRWGHSSGKLLSWFLHVLPAMVPSIPLCQGVCVVLKPFVNHACAMQVLCFEEPRDLMRTFPVSGTVQLFIGREAVMYEMNEFHKQLLFNMFFQFFFPWDFPPSCACFPHLICCERIDFQRKKIPFWKTFLKS